MCSFQSIKINAQIIIIHFATPQPGLVVDLKFYYKLSYALALFVVIFTFINSHPAAVGKSQKATKPLAAFQKLSSTQSISNTILNISRGVIRTQRFFVTSQLFYSLDCNSLSPVSHPPFPQMTVGTDYKLCTFTIVRYLTMYIRQRVKYKKAALSICVV